jgi:hypothetical protein
MVMVKIAWLYKKHGDGDDCGYDGDDYGVGNMMEIMVLVMMVIMVLVMMVIMMVNGEGCGLVMLLVVDGDDDHGGGSCGDDHDGGCDDDCDVD